jgi:Eukaryotic phosphomannomutase
MEFLEDLRDRVLTGVVGGSDLAKAKEQLGEDCPCKTTDFRWIGCRVFTAFPACSPQICPGLISHFQRMD